MPYLQGQAAQSLSENTVATHPLELVHLDYLCLEPRKGLEENVLVVTDHFTPYIQTYVTWTQPPQTTAKTLWDKFIVHYGLPKKIFSDQGRNFESQLVADVCKLMGTQKLWTSLYHPQTNGQCERCNCTLIGMLGMLPPKKISEWKNHIGVLVHAYNCTWNSATGFGPYYLMYGRQPCLPVDVTLWLAPCSITAPKTAKFMQKMWEHVKWAHKKAETFQAKEAQCHKQNFDKRSKAAAFKVRNTVQVHVTAFKGHHKIQDWWENREYVVEKWPYPNVPVYVVCPREGEGHSWTLHRNYLLPISSNLEHNEKDAPVAGVEHTKTSTPAPSVDNEPADAEPSRMVTSSTAGNMSQDSPDQPAPLRCGTHTTWNWLPWRYWNFGLLADTSLPSIWDAWVGLCICLHFISCLYTVFWGSMV